MPSGFGRGLRRSGGFQPISLTIPRREETAPPPDLATYWPDQERIQEAKTEYEKTQDTPLWVRLLNVPSNILGREAFTRGIKGAAEGGIGGAVGGFLEGEWDAISHAFGLIPGMEETRFRDIRKAFGDMDTDTGVANFAINLLGDVLLDPVSYTTPLGLISKAESAATLAAKGLTLEKQVMAGIRGGMTFRIPILMQTGLDIMPALGHLPLPYFDKFKSLNVQFARGMDQLFGIVRTSPIIGPVLQKFGAVGVRDPEMAARIKQARILSREDADVYLNTLLERYHKLPQDLKEAIGRDQNLQYGIVDLMESGILKLDNEGRIADYMKRLPQVMRNQAFRGAYQKDETFRALWKTAATGEGDEAVKAVKKLYEGYDFRLPQKWLNEAGLSPRLGVDIESATDTLAGGLGTALGSTRTPMELARADSTALARGAGDTGQQAFRKAQEGIREARFRDLWRRMDSGEINKAEVEELLSVHLDAMETVGAVDRASGAINGLMEPYFPRITNPAVKRLIDKQQLAGLKRLQFGDGKAQFQHARSLTDMTTTEASAFLMEIGSTVTGFEGLNVSVQEFKREFAEHGHWAVLKHLFPDAFVKKLNRIDDDLGSFFRSNPILADYWRIRHSAEVFQKNKFYEYAFGEGSPLLLDSVRLADPKGAMSLIQTARAKGWQLNLVGKAGTLPKPVDAGDIITQTVGKDLRARIGIHEDLISRELDEALKDTTTTFDERILQYQNVLRLGNKSDLAFSNATPYAEAMLKRSITEKRNASTVLAGVRSDLAKLKGEMAAGRQPLMKEIDNLQKLIDNDKAMLEMLAEGGVDWKRVDEWNAEISKQVEAIMEGGRLLATKRSGLRTAQAQARDALLPLQEKVLAAAGQLQRARAQEFSVRASVKHTLENMRTARREVLGQQAVGAVEKAGELRQALKQLRQGLTPEMVSNEAKLWYRFRKEGTLGWDELSPAAQERMLKAGGDARLVAMHPEALASAKAFYSEFTKPDSLRGQMWVTALDSIRTWFVGMTVMHPAMIKTRMADVLGGLITAGQGGYFSPERMAVAGKMTHAIGRAAKEGLSPGDVLEPVILRNATNPAITMTGADALQHAQRFGLVGADVIKDSLLDVVSESAALKGQAAGTRIMDWALGFFGLKRPSTNPVLRVGQKFARYGDDAVRMQTFLSAWDKNGGNVQDALRTAMHWTYGAGKDITSFERYGARRLIPFFGFLKWATMRSTEMWLTKPASINWLGHVRENAVAALNLKPENLQRALPAFVNDNLGIPVMDTPEGPKMYLFGSLFPLGNAFDLVNAATNMLTGKPLESLRYVGQNMHPVLKSAGELVLNRDFFSGREVSLFPGDTAELLGVEMKKPIRHVLKSWFRGLAELDRLNVFNAQEMRVAVDAVRRGDVLGRRKELPLIERFLSSAFGPVPPKGYQIDVEEELRYARRKDQEKLNESKSLLRKAVSEGKTAEVGALQDVIAEELASIQARQELATRYAVNEAATKKIRLLRR